MSLEDLSFKLYTDDTLSTPFAGLYSLIHFTDLSDNPQDFVLYFGSTNAANQLDATSNPGVDDVELEIVDALAVWAAATAYAAGVIRQPTTPNGLKYKVTTAGTSHASVEPTWPTVSIGSTVSDGTVVWTLVGAKHEIEEITLGLTSGDLDTNTPGDPLPIAPTIEGGVANAVEIHIRVENAVTTVQNNVGYPDVGIDINEVIETEIV